MKITLRRTIIAGAVAVTAAFATAVAADPVRSQKTLVTMLEPGLTNLVGVALLVRGGWELFQSQLNKPDTPAP